jgi:hypothetical protein
MVPIAAALGGADGFESKTPKILRGQRSPGFCGQKSHAKWRRIFERIFASAAPLMARVLR